MYNIGLHLGYWWGTAAGEDLRQMVALTGRAGLDVFEINPAWLLELTVDQCREIEHLTRDNNLTMTLNGGLFEHNDIASDSAEARRRGIEYCIEVLRKMPSLGISLWSGVNYSAWLRAPAPNSDILEEKRRAQELSLKSLREILPVAEDLGIDYCFEVVNRYEQFLFNTTEEAVDFAKATGSPRAKVHLDTYHMNIEEDCLCRSIRHAGQQGVLGHIHVGESNRRVPHTGPGNLDWPAIAEAIADSGYRGALVMEPFILTSAFNAKRTRTWRDYGDAGNLDSLVDTVMIGGDFLRSLFT